jgi:hypothetical protein
MSCFLDVCSSYYGARACRRLSSFCNLSTLCLLITCSIAGEPIALTIYRAEINYEKSFQAAELHKIRARQERREGVHGGHAESSESRARDVGNVPNNATALSSDSRPILSSAAAQAASQAMETLARMEQTISPPQSGISDVAPLANEAIARAKQTVTRAAAQAPTPVATSTATKQHAHDTYPDPSLEGTRSVDRSVAVGGSVAVGVRTEQMGAIHRLSAGGPPSSGGAVGAVGGGGGWVGAAGAGAGSVGLVPFEMQGAQRGGRREQVDGCVVERLAEMQVTHTHTHQKFKCIRSISWTACVCVCVCLCPCLCGSCACLYMRVQHTPSLMLGSRARARARAHTHTHRARRSPV